MARAGFRTDSLRESGVVVLFESDRRCPLYVTEVDGKANIILAPGKE